MQLQTVHAQAMQLQRMHGQAFTLPFESPTADACTGSAPTDGARTGDTTTDGVRTGVLAVPECESLLQIATHGRDEVPWSSILRDVPQRVAAP